MQKTALLILDGWGLNPDPATSAIAAAATPFFDKLISTYPSATLCTYGQKVGLPEGQMGNSEVGHLNIGAGRVVYQELARINNAASAGELAKNPALLAAIAKSKSTGAAFHLIGLVSDGGVHSHINHLLSLCNILIKSGLPLVYIHAFTDGRDCSPHSAKGFISQLLAHIKGTNIKLATIIGRYYAMDRDKRWERIAKAYKLLTQSEGLHSTDPIATIQDFYNQNITDEFLPAINCSQNFDDAEGSIINGDVLLSFNFRTDRCRQISEVLTQIDMDEYEMLKLDLHYFTMCRYDDSYKNVSVLFEKENLTHTLGEVIAQRGLTQLRIAETEKYPHVSFFFSGGREAPFEGETRIIIPSAKVATYDLQPEMSAQAITKAAVDFIDKNSPHLVVLNFANTDMVGHTGVFAAAVVAAQTVDNCLAQLVPHLLAQNYQIVIIADHGNADVMLNPDGSPNTAHSTNPVPLIYINPSIAKTNIQNGKLADIAPTILSLMGIDIPPAMTGEVIIYNGY